MSDVRRAASLRGLRTFCIAARAESFSAAADALFITPSAVSHQIKSLETELGVRLFERSARDLRLTALGRDLYNDVGPLIEQVDDVVGSYREGSQRTSVRMSVQPFFASEYFVPRLGEFTDKHPEVDIHVRASDETTEIHPSDAALSIRLFRSPPTDVESTLLLPLRLVPAGSKALAESIRVDAHEVVSDLPLIVHESYPKAWKQWAAHSGMTLPKASKITRLDSMIAVVRAAERGIGAALVPVPIADQWFHQGTITRLFDAELIADVSYYLIWRPEEQARPGVQLLKDWILSRFGVD